MTDWANLAASANLEQRSRAAIRWVADPERLARLQLGMIVVASIWAISSASSLVWSFYRAPAVTVAPMAVVNPPEIASASSVEREVIDVSSIIGLNIFGSVEGSVGGVTSSPASTISNPRDGIEDGAKETSLALVLTGIVSSTDDGLGSAMIEAKKQQSLYSVGDALPANGKVTLAKILAKQVVIDNNGTYELITLFDDNGIVGILPTPATPTTAPRAQTSSGQPTRQAPRIDQREANQLASGYRQQLYDDPQSLASLVSISAVQGENGLRGYRIAPGRDQSQFAAMGFEPGDIVTAVNGYSLSDPSNTVRLYQLMRDATGATFDIERGGSALTISVSLTN